MTGAFGTTQYPTFLVWMHFSFGRWWVIACHPGEAAQTYAVNQRILKIFGRSRAVSHYHFLSLETFRANRG